jgi:putative FmdB family regulatory protein
VPTYAYACTECGHDFEAVQSFSDDSLTECPQCSGRLRKVFSNVGIVFKGSGFYRTDSRTDKGTDKGADKAEAGTKDGAGGKDGGSKDGGTKDGGTKEAAAKADGGAKAGAGSGSKGAGTSSPSTPAPAKSGSSAGSAA